MPGGHHQCGFGMHFSPLFVYTVVLGSLGACFQMVQVQLWVTRGCPQRSSCWAGRRGLPPAFRGPSPSPQSGSDCNMLAACWRSWRCQADITESSDKQPGGDGNSSCLLWKETLKAKEQHCLGGLPCEKQLEAHLRAETEVMQYWRPCCTSWKYSCSSAQAGCHRTS